uniref:Acetyltransferase n=1 Tax=Oryza nivara TaxID=4536 RepID=A0A0E0HWE4_ORYNI
MPPPPPTPPPSPPVRVVSTRTVKPSPPRPRERIPLTTWDVSLLAADYIQKGLLFRPPPATLHLVEHLAAALADALHVYYPVAGRFATDKHPGGGCSVSIDCDGQGAQIVHAVADGVSTADILPPDVDVPSGIVRSFFPLDEAVNYDGHELPLFVVQVTELVDGGVFLGFVYNHALSDGTAFWDFLNAWAEIARAKLENAVATSRAPLLERWSPDGGAAAPVVLPYDDLEGLIARTTTTTPPLLRERMLHFSAESLAALKERARRELLAAGDAAGAAAVTRFQALSSLLWRCVTRARRLAPGREVVFRASVNSRGRLRPPLPPEYFGNSILPASTEAVPASELLARGHGWAAAAVGRAVAAHTDERIRARSAVAPSVSAFRLFDASGVFVSSSPRFDMYGCDFGWGKAVAARSSKGNKYDGKVSLFPGRDGGGGGGIDAEVELAPEHMAALEEDGEFWAAVTPDHLLLVNDNNDKA